MTFRVLSGNQQMKTARCLLSVLCFGSAMVLMPHAAVAEKTADIQEITIIGSQRYQSAPSINQVSNDWLEAVGGATLGQQLIKLPGVHIQTNSRGETLFYSRGSGERQVALFFEGAPLNVPWDNRFDLAAFPTALIGSIRYRPSARTLEYGPNSAAGGLNLLLGQLTDKEQIDAELSVGQRGYQALESAYRQRFDRLSLNVGLTWRGYDAQPLSGDANLPYNQGSDGSRTNSFNDQMGIASNLTYDLNLDWQVGVSVLYVETDKGVPPEGHLDGIIDEARYWQKPKTDVTMLIANTSGQYENLAVKASGWYQAYKEHIYAYQSVAYETLDEISIGEGDTFGARLSLALTAGNVEVDFYNQFSVTDHDKYDGLLSLADKTNPENFEQNLYSTGLSAIADMGSQSQFSAGLGYDRQGLPITGFKNASTSFDMLTAFAGVDTAISNTVRLDVGFTQKGRFPTMRELFDGALNRFLLNADLTPETVRMFDATMEFKQDDYRLAVVPFYKEIKDTISQENVVVDGDRKRRRVNLKGSDVLGLELSAQWQPQPSLTVSASATMLDYSIRHDEGEVKRRPIEIPQTVLWLGTHFDGETLASPLNMFFAGVELYHRGGVYSPDIYGDIVKLPSGQTINLKAGLHLDKINPNLKGLDFYVSLDNVFDSLIIPQSGLPEAGRWFRSGLKFTY